MAQVKCTITGMSGKRILAALVGVLVLSAFAIPQVSDLKVTPVAPWGLAIDYTVSGVEDAETNMSVFVTATVNGTNYKARTLSGVTNWVNGSHRVYWNMAKDGISATVADSVVTVADFDYCVIDMSGGTSATSYPISYLPSVPTGGWTVEYKTTKLVLRRIKAGSFIMGPDQSDESHRVTLTKPFYMGVFEVTQKQWELVMGTKPSYFSNASCYATRPVEQVSYNDIRGSSAGAGWPASSAVDATSFLGKLRSKTGLDGFDLPTEAQWEYACRAGTTSMYNNGGDTEDDLITLGRYGWSSSMNPSSSCGTASGTAAVGSYAPNAWGLYDMHGNVSEWCLDRYGDLSYGVDPAGLGSSSGSYRVLRGGGWGGDADYCTSSYRYNISPSCAFSSYGFRIVRTLNNKTE